MSRASRDRRRKAIDASSDVEGYHIDWLFTVCILKVLRIFIFMDINKKFIHSVMTLQRI